MLQRSIPWLVLLASAVLEAVWATALGLSDGFTKPLPTQIFAVTAVLSMLGLGMAIRHIPLGTAYAVWVGIGALGAVAAGILLFGESRSPARLAFAALLVVSIVGLKATAR